jgi:hypothetical protein
MTLNLAPAKRPKLEDYRGIPVETLLELVKNTAPFVFADLKTADLNNPDEQLPEYIQKLREFNELPAADRAAWGEDLWHYFELAFSAHFASVGTFVPTDVDLAIREKLWKFVHHPQAWSPLWQLIQRSLQWDESFVSKRVVVSKSGQKISGHQGEWFTVAMGAYGCAKKVAPSHLVEVREAIEAELERQEQALLEIEQEFVEDPVPSNARTYSDAVSAVVHNLGDLDRMFDAWELDESDLLKRRVYRSGHEDARSPRPVFLRAGKVYQKCLATENHRHFALREPKCIRQSGQYLLNYGPWLDEWGQRLVTEGYKTEKLTERDLRDVVVALVTGWKTLNSKSIYTSVGYARALAGVAVGLGGGQLNGVQITASQFSTGKLELEALVPPIIRRELVEGGLRTLLGVGRAQFEKEFSRKLFLATGV